MFETTVLTAADVMTREVTTVAPDATVQQAARLMVARGVSGLPVVDGEGHVLGMLAQIDLVRPDDSAALRRDWWLNNLAEGHDLAPDFLASMRAVDRKVERVMAHDLVTVRESTNLHDVAKLFAEMGIRRVAVVRPDGVLCGVVSRSDLVRVLARGAE